MTKAQDIIYFGGLLSICSCLLSKQLEKVFSLLAFTIFSVGTTLSSYATHENTNIILFGLALIVIGLIGIFGLSLRLILRPEKESYVKKLSNQKIFIDKLFAIVLLANLALRSVTLHLSNFLPLLMITNVTTVLLSSTAHSWILSNELDSTKVEHIKFVGYL